MRLKELSKASKRFNDYYAGEIRDCLTTCFGKKDATLIRGWMKQAWMLSADHYVMKQQKKGPRGR